MIKINSRQKSFIKKLIIGISGFFLLLLLIIGSYSFYITFIKEKPPLNLPYEIIKNYSGNFDEMNFDNLGIKFKIKTGGIFKKYNDSFGVEYKDGTQINFKMSKVNNYAINFEKSLKDYEGNGIKYKILKNTQISGDFMDVLDKKRNDTFFTEKYIIRNLNNVSYDEQKNPIGDIEILTGDQKKLEKVYINILKESFIQLNKFTQDDLESLDENNVFIENLTSKDNDKTYFTSYNVLIDKENTYNLNSNIINNVQIDYLNKYDYSLSQDELNSYKEKIGKERNVKYFKIRIFKLYYYKGHIYFFMFNGNDGEISLKDVLVQSYSNTFVKDVEIKEPDTTVIRGESKIYENMSFILPEIYKVAGIDEQSADEQRIEGNTVTSNKLTFIPYILNYDLGKIYISTNTFDDNDFSITDYLTKQIDSYIGQDFINRNKNVLSSKLIKKDEIKLGGFDKVYKIVYEVKTVNGDIINLINIFLFNNDKKTINIIEYSYSNKEILTIPSFKTFVNSIKKIK